MTSSFAKQLNPAINLASEPLVPAYDVTQDEDMTRILNSMSNHLNTINSNLNEMKDVRAWIHRAEESLSEILRRLGGPAELDHVYGAELM